MTFTPMLLGAALIFWGWHTGLWWLGLPLALLVELPAYLRGYWEFGLRERQRVADLCGILAILVIVYQRFMQPPLAAALILMVQWAPVLFFPLLAMQLYGGRPGMEWSVLIPSLRDGRPGSDKQLDLRPFYLLICLLGTAMVKPPGTFYYLGLGLVVVWALWPLRPPAFAPWRWGGALVLALSLGYSISIGLTQLQIVIEEQALAWITGYFNIDEDPYRTTTAIGDIGRLKLSEQIMLRVWPDVPPVIEPLLLRSTSFTRYINGTWLSEHKPFQPLIIDAQGWHVPGTGTPKRWVKVAMELPQGRGMLPIPNGVLRLQGLQVAQLSGNGTGVVKIQDGPDLASYKADYGGAAIESPPNAIDLRIPPAEIPALAQVVQKLRLPGLPVAQALERIQDLFQRHFHYSLQLKAPPARQSALAYFLTHSRTGHCEYFASAAVLLLRQAGIPARYAQGWSVQEYSDLEHAYIARARHAHAWVLVWVNGAWQDFDPTPPDWGRLEAEQRPWWEEIHDLWSWLHYRLINQTEHKQTLRIGLMGGLIALIVLLAWRITRHGRRANKHQETHATVQCHCATVFTSVEQLLVKRTGVRSPNETLRNWLARLQHQGEPTVTELIPVLGLYYRQRFDPQGLNAQDTQRLEALVGSWLARFKYQS